MGLFFNRKPKETKDPVGTVETIEEITDEQPQDLSKGVQIRKPRTADDLLSALGAMTAGLAKNNHDATKIKKRIEQFPGLIYELLNKKTAGGSFVFYPVDINVFLENANKLETDLKYAQKVLAVLDEPEEIHELSYEANKGFALFRAVEDPLDSTIQKNPDLFSNEPTTTKTRQKVHMEHYPPAQKTTTATNSIIKAYFDRQKAYFDRQRQAVKGSAPKNSGNTYYDHSDASSRTRPRPTQTIGSRSTPMRGPRRPTPTTRTSTTMGRLSRPLSQTMGEKSKQGKQAIMSRTMFGGGRMRGGYRATYTRGQLSTIGTKISESEGH